MRARAVIGRYDSRFGGDWTKNAVEVGIGWLMMGKLPFTADSLQYGSVVGAI